MTVDEHVDRVVAEAPSWEELPVDSRATLLRVFRPVHPVEAEPSGRSA